MSNGMSNVVRALARRGAIRGNLLVREPLAKYAYYQIGGPAELYVECQSVEEIARVTEACLENEVPYQVLGGGSNVLIADAGVPGVTIRLCGPLFTDSQILDEKSETARLFAPARDPLGNVARLACLRGMGGMEFAFGIPGTLGGAVYMNAGTGSAWLDQVVESVDLFVPGQGRVTLGHDDLNWGYRTGGIPEGAIILAATLALQGNQDATALARSLTEALKRRAAHQPIRYPSCGSVFKNPEGDHAGRLIEACGLKGHQIGGAQISEVHANFIVNLGGATAADVLALIELAQARVLEEAGIELQREVKFLGPVA